MYFNYMQDFEWAILKSTFSLHMSIVGAAEISAFNDKEGAALPFTVICATASITPRVDMATQV